MSPVAWVTGGGTGIGRALAEALYREGYSVVISGRRANVLQDAARTISRSSGSGKIHFVAGDASDPMHIQQLLSETASRWGDICLLINNAGSNDNTSIRNATAEEYERAFQNNCLSAIRATQAILPRMIEKGAGAIVNISSVYGRWGTATSATYSVSKFAVAGYTEALQQSVAGSPVRVLSVFPGYIQTAMTNPFVQKGTLRARLGKTPEQMARAILKALQSNRRELYFPWYVPWVLRLHRWFPKLADQLANRVKR